MDENLIGLDPEALVRQLQANNRAAGVTATTSSGRGLGAAAQSKKYLPGLGMFAASTLATASFLRDSDGSIDWTRSMAFGALAQGGYELTSMIKDPKEWFEPHRAVYEYLEEKADGLAPKKKIGSNLTGWLKQSIFTTPKGVAVAVGAAGAALGGLKAGMAMADEHEEYNQAWGAAGALVTGGIGLAGGFRLGKALKGL